MHSRAADHRAAAETIAVQVSVAIMVSSREQALLPGYLASVDDKPSKERYLEKLRMLNGLDPYELATTERVAT